MRSKFSRCILTVLALAIIFSLPALACSLLPSNLSSKDSSSKETDMAVAVKATLTSNAEIQAAQVTLTPPPSPTLSPPPTLEPLPTLTDIPEPTSPPVPTPTPSHTGPWMGDITFARDITSDNQPVDPGTVFKRGVTTIYAIFPFSGLEDGKKVTYYWAVNGKEFVSALRTWSRGSSGTAVASTAYANNRQLDSGNWQLSIFYNNKLLASGSFKIMP